MSTFFEMAMVLCFGISWPLSIRKSWVSRSTKGKSLHFTLFIFVGYIFGIMSKILGLVIDGKPINYTFFGYALNLIMVGIDILLYFRNRRIEAAAEKQA